MAYYSVCPICGCSLDPGEKCDCEEQARKERAERRSLFQRDPKTGQMKMVWRQECEKVV